MTPSAQSAVLPLLSSSESAQQDGTRRCEMPGNWSRRAGLRLALLALSIAPLSAAESAANLNRRDVQGGTPVSVQDRPYAVFFVINATPPRTCRERWSRTSGC